MERAVHRADRTHKNEQMGAFPAQSLPLRWAGLGSGRREELLRRIAEGGVNELEFEAIVYRAGSNRNHLLIRDEDLPRFAESFVGVPFLRDHNVESVEARAGVVVTSVLDGRAIRQTIRLTTQRDIRAFAEGQIDRFSVSWYYDDVLCSICGQAWGECSHKAGRTYETSGREGRRRRRCELVFLNPQGKEVSAVNAPAVEGTRLLTELTLKELDERGNMNDFADESMVAVNEGEGEECGVPAQAQARGWLAALRDEVTEGLIARSGLSAGGRNAVRAALYGEAQATPERVRALIAAQSSAEQQLGGARAGALSSVRNIHPTISGMRSAEDEVQAALNWLVGDVRSAMPAPHLRNLRDLYLAITGDVNFWGVFAPEHARLQSANSGTLAGMAVNALNKAVMLHYDNLLTYRWYEQIVHVLPHDGSTQQIQLIRMDGIAALPAVAEGAAYTEATTGDSKETATFTKYGSYVGITLEMIRRSDIARIQAIPRLLVQAAIRRRSAAIASIFTSNPTLADDSLSLFHATHGNADTTAFGTVAWEAARTRIFEQSLPGTGKPLALWPTYCLVPIELYDDALTAFGYGSGDVGKPNSGGTAQEPNIYGLSRPGDPRPVPIVVPEWTDSTDWAYIVDPRLHPVIVMAYAGSPAGGLHALPELFEVRSESAGLLFSNDTLPVKVRDWWAYGVTTHVGVGKNTVAG